MSTNETLNPLVGRRLYLATYSQADENLFPSRKSFGDMLEEEFNEGMSKSKVKYWACCRELHKNGGIHYHCTLLLTGCKKWISIKNKIHQKYGIQINFSGSHDFYISAYRYICKEDTEVFHSQGHPVDLLLKESPPTKQAIQKRRSQSSEKTSSAQASSSKKKVRRLSNLNVADFVRENKISSYTELLAAAELRRDAGQNDIAEFVYNRTEKHLNELVSKTWKMCCAQEVLDNNKISRIDLLEKQAASSCLDNCNGKWLECATEVLGLNGIPLYDFAESIKNLIIKGRGKGRNILIIGPANCAKTFILKPLNTIFGDKVFENPAHDKYAWVGAEKAQLILLNDFRWTKELIRWSDLLLLLEGETVKLPAPKNLYSEDIKIISDVPIFATSKTKITYRGSYNMMDEMETEMMNVRWKTFKFTHMFHFAQQKTAPPCGKCFASLVLTSQHL